MPRGRKRDLTLPPSRSLAAQRAFRERKAQFVADLEERCQRAESENVRLKEDVRVLREELDAMVRGQTGAYRRPSAGDDSQRLGEGCSKEHVVSLVYCNPCFED